MSGTPICPTCHKRVYFNERLTFAGKDYHKIGCFKCTSCHKTLEISKARESDGMPYCANCHAQKQGLKGFQPGNVLTSYTGYGGGKGEVDNSTVVGGRIAEVAAQEEAEQMRNAPVRSAPTPSDLPKFCPSCGAKNNGGKFCSECGNKF
ncbi:cysteine-rich protein, putative [Entamoeba dispar SAW760]|uniref:Cysteine-rich protein, putative n=1 Tax=Entamoeba dispar (strain ATCC PRA-260 / SAW760) TaxID=370354 RepID=B0EVA4_ENTDS|nr:cysteine-rich protein, putative [Entamoeba dispar SAW760]EDR21516.1 cysteine-rich protein, putative [Entamoeba dispar SAW760]|eukprot:EDR21516.1 cysteine-rich protein, putative [Entamoeba dispar SAW760]